MNQNEALQNLINGVEKGQSKGIYSLEEAAKFWESIRTFFPPEIPKDAPIAAPNVEPNKNEKNENN